MISAAKVRCFSHMSKSETTQNLSETIQSSKSFRQPLFPEPRHPLLRLHATHHPVYLSHVVRQVTGLTVLFPFFRFYCMFT